MTTIDPQAPVMVTGATGYVAGRLVEKLLEKGHTVHAAVRDPENQVKIFSPEGKPLRDIGRRGGRRLIGPWQADGMAFAAGIAVDAKGQLWVAEADSSPKRISVWNAANGAPAKEFFGPTAYGALGGAINPLDPNLMVGIMIEVPSAALTAPILAR